MTDNPSSCNIQTVFAHGQRKVHSSSRSEKGMISKIIPVLSKQCPVKCECHIKAKVKTFGKNRNIDTQKFDCYSWHGILCLKKIVREGSGMSQEGRH